MCYQFEKNFYLCKKVMKKTYNIALLFLLVQSCAYAQISFNLEVEQSVDGNELVLDFMVERPVGSTPFAFGSSNFSVYVNAAALNIPGLYKDAAFDGPWDNDYNPVNYFDVSVGHNNSNYVNMNINYIVGSPGSGTTVPEGKTRIGRMRIPITDPTQCNFITWRIPPLAIKQHDGSSIKSYANFINSTFCMPLCAEPPLITQAVSKICGGTSAAFSTQNSSSCSLVVANGTANAQITTLDTASHLVHFTGNGSVTLRFTGSNGCSRDTIVVVNANPELIAFQNLCSGSTAQFSGNSTNLNWYIFGHDTSLSFSDTVLLGNQDFSTQINGYGSFTLHIEDAFTLCGYDTIIEIYQMDFVQAQPIYLCLGDTFTVQLNHSVPNAQWLIPNSFTLISGGMTLDSFAVLQTVSYGNDTITVLGLDFNGCSYELHYVVITDVPIIQFHLTQSVDSLSNMILVSPYEPVQWYRNDTLITGIQNDTLIVSQSGNYYAVYANSCGIYFSDTLNIIPTTKNITQHNSFIMYPNPNDGHFYIQVHQNGEYQINIYDGIGKLIYKQKFKGKIYHVQLKEITEGVYTIEIEGIGVQKWIYKK